MFEDSVILGLGTNLGDRMKNLQRALSKISDIPTTYILDYSSIYETAPVGYLQQDRFLNMAVRISTWIQPLNFLAVLKQIERNLGRIKTIKWGPRIIDIDILFWGKKIIDTEILIVPHPQNENRAFVQVPVQELSPQFALTPRHELAMSRDNMNSEIMLHTPKTKIEF